MSEPMIAVTPTRQDRWVQMYLKFVGSAAIVAFFAAVMPEKWIVEIAEELGFDPFPHSPLTFYLARNLSLLYGFTGASLWLVALDLDRYRPLVFWIAIGTILFGILQAIVDSLSGLPTWWTLRESLSTFFGGWALLFLERLATKAYRSR